MNIREHTPMKCLCYCPYPYFRDVPQVYNNCRSCSYESTFSQSVGLFMRWTRVLRKDKRKNVGHEMREEFQTDMTEKR